MKTTPTPNISIPVVGGFLAGLLALGLGMLDRPAPAFAATFLVNVIDDSDDGVCDATHCSLREAIHAANDNPGPDEIDFDLAPSEGHIQLYFALPPLTDDGTVIDGMSEPDYVGTPVVVIEPCYVPSDVIATPLPCVPPQDAIRIEADGVVIRGLSIVGFSSTSTYATALYSPHGAIRIASGTGALIEDNYLGLFPSGGGWGNGFGLRLESAGHTVSGNVISDNEFGIDVLAGAQTITGNRIGTDPSGMSPHSNQKGIIVRGASAASGAAGPALIIGGSGTADGNTISGNVIGVFVDEGAPASVTVTGNRIGTDLTGTAAVPNMYGVELAGPATVGGSASGEGNLISGNLLAGVLVGEGALGVEVVGNTIGLASDGSILPPRVAERRGSGSFSRLGGPGNGEGIVIHGDDSQIGGLLPGEGNVISGNAGDGIRVEGSNIVISGNWVGTDVSGSTPLGNQGRGITIDSSSGEVTHNTIAFNSSEGVWSSCGITLSENSMRDNGGLGFDHSCTAFPPPVLTEAGSLYADGTSCPGCLVEIFIADPDPSGGGEGYTHLVTATTDSSGAFHAQIPSGSGVGACTSLTATTTDSSGNTSEFSENIFPDCVFFNGFWIPGIVLTVGIVGTATGAMWKRMRGDRAARWVPSAVAGGLLGGVAGVALTAAVLALPNVQLARTEAPPSDGATLPACTGYLDPAAFSPADGTVFATYENPPLAWSPLPDLPSGEIRWRVDLFGPDGLELSRVTSDTSMPFSAFWLLPFPGDSYRWGVAGEIAQEGSDLWLPFCDAEIDRGFQMSSPRPTRTPSEASKPGAASPTTTVTPSATPTATASAPPPTVTRVPPTKTATPTATPMLDTTGPSIKSASDSPDPIKVTQPKGCTPNTSVVSASISDASGVASAVVLFFHTTIGSVPMSNTGGDSWQATLGPYTGVGDGTVDYQIRATDSHGNVTDTAFYQITVLACIP